jgi:hypothetical protein
MIELKGETERRCRRYSQEWASRRWGGSVKFLSSVCIEGTSVVKRPGEDKGDSDDDRRMRGSLGPFQGYSSDDERSLEIHGVEISSML